MSAKSPEGGYIVWNTDRTAQSPVELPTLVGWIRGGKVTADTWLFLVKGAMWQRAADVPELQMFFHADLSKQSSQFLSARGLDLQALRRVRLLSYMTDEQLARFASFVEAERMPQGAVIVKQGDLGTAMYVLLEGEVSVRLNLNGLETELATLNPGDFFGDFSLFDHGPRSADVVANSTCLLLKISVDHFERIAREAPELATPFLRAIGKTLTTRIRTGNKHQGEAVKMAHALE
jgi:CRP/FNR family cyclic AMP-dependent transcriptional regulator